MAEREDVVLGKVTVTTGLEFAPGATTTIGSTLNLTSASITAGAITTASIATGTIATSNLTNAPTITGTVASSVTALIKNGSGHTVLATCATANIPTGAGYAKGCLLLITDGTDHTDTLFTNIGTTSAANFNAVTVAAD